MLTRQVMPEKLFKKGVFLFKTFFVHFVINASQIQFCTILKPMETQASFGIFFFLLFFFN